MTASSRYAALDGLRGFAVLLVFFVHAAGNSAAVAFGVDFERTDFWAVSSVTERVLFWLFRSHHGVFLFFVLSGFLIGRMWWNADTPPKQRSALPSPQGGPSAERKLPARLRAAVRRAGRPGGARPSMTYARFAWRRTLRIYPAFLLAFAASLGFAYHSGTWTPPDFPRAIGNLFFLNGAPGSHVVPFNLVTWSLFYEMTFYFAFPLLAVVATTARARVVVAGAGIVLPVLAATAGADVLVLCWSLLFLGVALAAAEPFLREKIARVPSLAIVVAYPLVTTAAMLDRLPAIAGILAFGVVALLVIARSLETGSIINRLLVLRPLRELGRVSYSFYLVHWMVVVLVARALEPHVKALGPLVVTLVIFGAGFVLSAVAATASWWLTERPYFAWLTLPAVRRNRVDSGTTGHNHGR